MRTFDNGRIQLYNDNCFNIFERINSKSIDLVLCDLPYGTTRNKWDSSLPLEQLWQQYERIIKDNGAILLFAQTPFDKALGSSNLKMLKYEWIWHKFQGTGHLNAKRCPLKIHENILVFYKKPPPYYPQMSSGKPYSCISGCGSSSYDTQIATLTINEGYRYPVSVIKERSDKGLHPTQKPVRLCEYFIKTYTSADAIVLDNCMGSGTTGVACIRQQRQFIGIEKDPDCYLIAETRIKNELGVKQHE